MKLKKIIVRTGRPAAVLRYLREAQSAGTIVIKEHLEPKPFKADIDITEAMEPFALIPPSKVIAIIDKATQEIIPKLTGRSVTLSNSWFISFDAKSGKEKAYIDDEISNVAEVIIANRWVTRLNPKLESLVPSGTEALLEIENPTEVVIDAAGNPDIKSAGKQKIILNGADVTDLLSAGEEVEGLYRTDEIEKIKLRLTTEKTPFFIFYHITHSDPKKLKPDSEIDAFFYYVLLDSHIKRLTKTKKEKTSLVPVQITDMITRGDNGRVDYFMSASSDPIHQLQHGLIDSGIVDKIAGTETVIRGDVTIIKRGAMTASAMKTLKSFTDIAFHNLKSGKQDPCSVVVDRTEYIRKYRGKQLTSKVKARLVSDIEALKKISFSYHFYEGTGKNRKKTGSAEIKPFGGSAIADEKIIKWRFNPDYLQAIGNKYKPLPIEYYRIDDGRHPNTAFFIDEVSRLKFINEVSPKENNRKRADVIGVKTLLKSSPILQSYEEKREKFSQLILGPFERDMDAAGGVFTWDYQWPKGKERDQTPDPKNLEEFLSLNVCITWADYPMNHIDGLRARVTKNKKKKTLVIEQGTQKLPFEND